MGSLFDGIKEAKASRGANYVRAGNYLVVINRVKLDVNRKKTAFVAIEMRNLVTLSESPDDKPHRPGERMSHLLMSDKDSFLGNLKAFISNVMGSPEDEVTEADCEAVTGESQPLAGMIVELQNKVIETKEKKPFTLVNYVRALEPDEVKSLIPQEVLDKFLTDEERALLEE
jgi:hypothetical protein